jgi:hypothetical protein
MRKSGECISSKGAFQLNKSFLDKCFSFRYTYFTRVIQYSVEEYPLSSALKCIDLPDGCTWREYFRQRAFQDKHIRLLLNDIISNRTTRKFASFFSVYI